MKFRNYCIVVMGNLEAVKDDIIKVAQTKPRYLDAKGILIATFSSVVEPSELKEFFNFNGRSFLLFDLNKDFSSYHLDNEKLHNHLFNHMIDSEDKLKEMSERLMNNISASTKDNVGVESGEIEPMVKRKVKSKIELTEMSKPDRENLVNSILDKGFEKLTNSDREILKKLSELK